MKFVPDIFPTNYPPKGGWTLYGVPPGLPDNVASLMDEREKWAPGDQGYMGPVNRVVKFLLDQRVTVDDALMLLIWEWANVQWCARDPERCKKTRKSQRAAEDIGHPTEMHWVQGFWQAWNAAMAGPADPVKVNQAMVNMARALIRGPYGCPKCARSWELNLEAFPVDRATDAKEARVWLWHVHNLTREGKAPTPYSRIAKIYQWAELTDAELAAIIAKLQAQPVETLTQTGVLAA